MKAFLAKYSGLTHTIAGLWLFLVGAYGNPMSSAFRDLVNGDAVALYHSLPASAAKIVSSLIALAVPLWAFYRNGQKGASATVQVLPGQSGTADAAVAVSKSLDSNKVGAFLLCTLLMGTLTGCPAQQTAASLMGVVGTAVASLETFEGNTALAAKIQADTAAAEAAVQNFKSGTPAQDVVEVLNIVEDDLNLFPIGQGDQGLIDLAIGTVDAVLALFPVPAPAIANSAYAKPHAEHAAHRAVALTHVPKTRAEFVAQWNSQARAQKPGLPALK